MRRFFSPPKTLCVSFNVQKKCEKAIDGEEGCEPKTKKTRTTQSAKFATGSKLKLDKEKDKALAGQKKFSKKFCRKCKGCGYFSQPLGMAINSALWIKYNHSLDQLTQMAKAQSKQKWLQHVRTDEEKCAKVLGKCAELTGDDGSGSKRKARFSQVVAFVPFFNECFHLKLKNPLETLLIAIGWIVPLPNNSGK